MYNHVWYQEYIILLMIAYSYIEFVAYYNIIIIIIPWLQVFIVNNW